MVDLKKFKAIFVSEVEDKLEILNKNFLLVEKSWAENDGQVDNKLYDDLMRASHTIKGSSASMGFNNTAFLAHVMEDIFDGARNNRLELNEEIIGQVFRSIDGIEKSLQSIKDNDCENDTAGIAGELKRLTGVNTVGVGKSVKADSASDNAPSVQPKNAKFDKKSGNTNIKNVTQGEQSEEDEVLESAKAKIDYIKVPVKRLDALLDLVEELLVDKMRLSEISHNDSSIKEIADHFNLLISGIQHEVMQARLVPVEQAFARFPRMIRDLAIKQKKKINFEVEGGDIELDRTVVDKLGEPLIHLLRNAVDHGISAKGTINLRAVRKSERVLFEVENDESGLDLEKIKAVAMKKGMLDNKAAQSIKEKDLIEMIFDPNFSTIDRVTEISGRGVGLNVVKKFVESFGGKVLVENYLDRVKFILELPLTLAIIETLLVKVGEEYFAIPFVNIERSVSVPKEDIKKMTDYDMAVIDGINVPLISLKDVFRLNNVEPQALGLKTVEPETADGQNESQAAEEKKSVIAVLVKKDKEMAGIVVDSLVSEQEVIVKPFSPVLRGIKGFSGSTILGDGSVVLILDVINLLKYFSRV